MNEMQENCAVKIAVRERPIRKNFKNIEEKSVITYRTDLNSNILIVDDRPFAFDYVLGPTVTQANLYDDLVKPLIKKVKDGFNCTAMAYGQTGTGKSYTMGLNTNNFDSEDVGVIPRCLRDLLDSTSVNEKSENIHMETTKVQVSFIEIYSEKVYDLLGDNLTDPIVSRGLKVITGSRKPVTTIKECRDILIQGTKNRHVRPTKMNSQSSRSHAIFTIYLKTERDGKILNSCLNLVDLAGSEGVRRTGHQGVALSEGVHINQGLLCIGKVLQAMIQGNKMIPYRDSVLSTVLQESLCCNSFLTLLACVSPHAEDLSETISTLRFAQNAKQLKNTPHINAIIAEIKKTKTKTPFKKLSNSSVKKMPLKNINLISNISAQKNYIQNLNKLPKFKVISDPSCPGVKRMASHSNTFCTPSKIKSIQTLKLNETEIGLTPKEKEKEKIRLAKIKPMKSLFQENIPETYRESISQVEPLDTTIDSRTSLISLNVSSSTTIDGPIPPIPTRDSPLLRKYMEACENAIDTKIQNFYTEMKRTDSIRTIKALHDACTYMHLDNNENAWAGSLLEELHSVINRYANPKTTNTALFNSLNSTSIDQNDTQRSFATSSPVFKLPKQPKLKSHTPVRRSRRISELKERLNESKLSEASFEISDARRRRSKSLIEMHERRRNFVSRVSQSPENVEKKKRRSKSKPMKIADGKNIKSAINNSIIASYFDARECANMHTTSKSTKLNKHRKAILDLLNSGSIKELQVLPQIGQKTAYQIVTHRTLSGKFKNLIQVEKLPVWRGNAWERFAMANFLM